MKDEIINSEEPQSIRYMYEGYEALQQTLRMDKQPKGYYTGVSKLFNGKTREFFMLVINTMIATYRGFNMPSVDDFKKYIKAQVETDKHHKLSKAIAQLPETSTPMTEEYERRAMQRFNEEYPQYRGVLKYEESPKTEKQVEASRAYFKTLIGVHIEMNPDSIFKGAMFNG